jgi:hypothetical protein
MRRATRQVMVALAVSLAGPVFPTAASEMPSGPLSAPRPSQGDFGGAGLMQTPIARMPETGSFALNYRDNDEYRFWSASLQLFPWMQATLRYADIRTELYSPFPGFSGDQTLKDKGIDVQFRLLEETRWRPELALGLRDFGGTGIFAGEYFVASKRFGFVDAHLGLGFGYLGRHDDFKNPFCRITDSFCERPRGTSGTGGRFETDKWFRGPTALFGGAEFATPWQPLSLQIEYDANDYRRDRSRNIEVDSRWNLGAVYRVGETLDLSLGWQRGNTLTFGFSLKTDFGRPSTVSRTPPPREPAELPPPPPEGPINFNRLWHEVTWDTGFLVSGIRVEPEDKRLVVSGRHIDVRDPEEAAERVARVLATRVPESIETYSIVEHHRRVPLVATEVDARLLREALDYPLEGPEPADAMHRAEPPEDTGDWNLNTRQARWAPSVVPAYYQSFGGPEAFYMYQLALFAGSHFPLPNNFTLSAYLGITLLDNYDKFNFTVDALDTPVPRVRTYVREYITGTDVRLENLQLSWFDRLGGPWYAQAYAGYLEMMFAGVGGELMYRPIDSKWAVGADINRVRQRDFDDRFGLMDYRVTTGHLSFYYEPPWPQGALVKLSAGQYLAGDRGGTIEFARRFDSGVVAGAYAVFTDVSSRDYGEGSFTKGLYLSIPLDILTNRPTRGRGTLPWLPLTRDGGQALFRQDELFYMTEDRSPFRR